MDIDERREDDGMEVEEEPTNGLIVPGDGPFEEVLQDDEVMGMEITQAIDATNPISIDGDIELDQGGEGDGDDMEPEPTPIEGATEDPFFTGTFEGAEEADVGDVEIDEAFDGEEPEGEEIQEDETPQESKEVMLGSGDPLTLEPNETAQSGSGAIGGVGGESSSSQPAIANPPTQPEQHIVASTPESHQPESTTAQLDVQEDQQVDDYTYPEDGVDENAGDLENEEEYTEDDIQEEDYEEEDEEELHDSRLDEMLTINTMPSVLLHLVGQPPKALFFPLDPADDLPDGVSTLTPVWFEGRHAELAQVPLIKLLEEIRRQINKPEYDHLEMSLEEKGLAVKLCQHDVHLNQVTLLEYLQVHYSCGLPSPVQFFVTFAPDRFWNRFDQIRKELVKAAEERKLAAIKRAAGGEVEEEQGRDVSEDGDEGYASGEEEEQTEEVMRRLKGDDNRAVYEESHVVDRRGKRDAGEAESAHPNADWATKLATGPLAFGIGNTSSPNPRSREPSQPIEAQVDAPAVPDVRSRGRSSKKEDDDQLADTTEASSTDSRHPAEMHIPRPAFGLDEIALKQRDEPVAAQEAVTPPSVVAKDEIELLHDDRVAQAADRVTIDDLENTEISSLAQDTPTGQINGKASDTVSDHDTSLASSLVPATPGLVTPPMTTISETPKRVPPGSSLINEVVPDTQDDEGIAMIQEEEQDEEEEEEEVEEERFAIAEEEDTYDAEVYEEGDLEGDENIGVIAESAEGDYEEEEYFDEEEGDKKDALIKAVDDKIVPKDAAIEAVGGEKEWEQYLEDDEERQYDYTETTLDTDPINPFVTDGPISASSSTTVEEDPKEPETFDDEGFYDGDPEPEVVPRSKRVADDDDDDFEKEMSSKRLKNDE